MADDKEWLINYNIEGTAWAIVDAPSKDAAIAKFEVGDIADGGIHEWTRDGFDGHITVEEN